MGLSGVVLFGVFDGGVLHVEGGERTLSEPRKVLLFDATKPHWTTPVTSGRRVSVTAFCHPMDVFGAAAAVSGAPAAMAQPEAADSKEEPKAEDSKEEPKAAKLPKARPRPVLAEYTPPRKNDGSSPPLSHYATHDPPDPRCETCRDARVRKQPAHPASAERRAELRALPPLGLVTMDLVGPTTPDCFGNVLLLTTRCVGTNFKRVMPLRDRLPATVWEGFRLLYPGSRQEPTPRFPALVTCDNDGSFKARFEEECRARGADFEWALPRRPETNALAESWHYPLESSTRAVMLHSNAPAVFWSHGAAAVVHCWARQPDDRSPEDGKVAFARFYGREDSLFEPVPFGCLATYLLEETERSKFGRPSGVGCFIAYGKHGGFGILEVEPFVQDQAVRIRMTRDVRFAMSSFPFKEEPRVIPLHDVEWSLERVHYANVGPLGAELDFEMSQDGRKRCLRCGYIITAEPVTCPACVDDLRDGSGKHGRGAPGPDCLRSRCRGHVMGAEQAVQALAPGAARKRMRAKQAICAETAEGLAQAEQRAAAVGDAPLEDDGFMEEAAAPIVLQEVARAPPVVPPVAVAAGPPTLEQRAVGPVVTAPPFLMLARALLDPASTVEKLTGLLAKLPRQSRSLPELLPRLSPTNAARVHGNLIRMVATGSAEARGNPRAQEAMSSEMNTLQTLGCFDLARPLERSATLASHPGAHYARGFMLLGEKGQELPPRLRRWKGRFVLQGN